MSAPRAPQPRLSPRRERFCLLIVQGENASDAYRHAFKPHRSKPKTIWEKASRLMADGKVQARIAELRGPVVQEAQLTLEVYLRSLSELRDKAIEAKQLGAAVAAEVHRGKVSGLYVEKVDGEVKHTHVVLAPPKETDVDAWQRRYPRLGKRKADDPRTGRD